MARSIPLHHHPLDTEKYVVQSRYGKGSKFTYSDDRQKALDEAEAWGKVIRDRYSLSVGHEVWVKTDEVVYHVVLGRKQPFAVYQREIG